MGQLGMATVDGELVMIGITIANAWLRIQIEHGPGLRFQLFFCQATEGAVMLRPVNPTEPQSPATLHILPHSSFP